MVRVPALERTSTSKVVPAVAAPGVKKLPDSSSAAAVAQPAPGLHPMRHPTTWPRLPSGTALAVSRGQPSTVKSCWESSAR